MAKELTGLEYLKKNEIKNMKCNMNKPFAFISYSHDEHDSQIVMNVFKKLMIKGYNLWIDTANMPVDENEWRKPAIDAMRNKNCRFAFYFRSESSMKKATIAEELESLKMLDHIKKIATIDIWKTEDMSAVEYFKKLLNLGGDDFYFCSSICKIVSKECKAIRLISDAGNDILSLVEEMEDELKNNGISPESNVSGNVNNIQIKQEENIVNTISIDKTNKPENVEKITTELKPEKVSKGSLRDKYKNKSAASVAKELFIPLLQSDRVSDDEIKKLQQKEYNKEEFHWSYCAIAPLDSNDKAHYYKEKYHIKGVDYMLCHEWTERTKTYLLDWIEKRDVESSEPHTINNDVKIQQLSEEKVHKEENIAKWEDNKIGEIANTILRELIESDKVTGTDVKNLQDKKYSLDTFQSSFPILINANLIPDDMKGRYYSTPIEKDGNRFYLCSQWYGEKVKKHQKEFLIKWIKEHQ
ncbi:MAG: toll/interleukin-1 receptor domain-containing protein [Lachnospiraceae bacterium]|nr:toll/interleukin-1 receptor domain-containing protein [Lachnospiraceae bacterium]